MKADGLLRDLAYGVRRLAKSPGFTLVAVLILALGIGATTSMFSVINGALLSELPFDQAHELVMVWSSEAKEDAAPLLVSYPDFLDWRSQAEVFEGMSAVSTPEFFNWTGVEQPERLVGECVSPNYFDLLGSAPLLGRTFEAGEAGGGEDSPVAVLSHGLWQRRFGGDRAAVGRTVRLNGSIFTVIGVMPADFYSITDQAELWIPMGSVPAAFGPQWVEERGLHWHAVVARLDDGVGLEQADAAMDVIAQRLAREFPEANEGREAAQLIPLAQYGQERRQGLLMLLGGAVLLLVIGCVNLANLLLARGMERRQEIGVRAALGASRRRLVRQLLAENLVLALLGALLAVPLAIVLTEVGVAVSAVTFPSYVDFGLDPRVLGVMVLVALVSTLLFGLVPTLAASRPDLSQVIKEGGKATTAARGRERLRGGLVVVEVALAVALLIAAGVLIKSFRDLARLDLGFGTEGLVAMRFDISGERYPEEADRSRLGRRLVEDLSSLPSVRDLALVGPDIPGKGPYVYDLVREGQAPDEEPIRTSRHHVAPGFFETLRTPVEQGRGFDDRDRAGAPYTIVISEAMAERHFPRGALGQRLRKATADPDDPWYTVVGVAGDVKYRGPLRDNDIFDVYLPFDQKPERRVGLLVRPRAGPDETLGEVRAALHRIDPDIPLYDVGLLEEQLTDQVAEPRFHALLMGFFAGTALLLGAIGLYGVLAVFVSQRSRAIGIRIALGARRDQVVKLVLSQGLLLSAAGAALGLVLALATKRFVESQLYGTSPTDPWVFAGVPLVLLAVALVATYLPARRAAAVDPATILKEE